MPLTPSELLGATWQDGTATCAAGEPPYLQFALKGPEFVAGVRLSYAYPAADGPSQFSLFWREKGRNDFTDQERHCRVSMPARTKWRSLTIPVNDTITDLRLYPDDQLRPGGGYACVFRLGQLSLLVRPAEGQRLLQAYSEPDVPWPVAPDEWHGVRWEEGTATCGGADPPHLQFTFAQPEFIRGLRLRYAYPEAAGASPFTLFWREQGRNDFAEERCYRLELPAGGKHWTMVIPGNDTGTDLRLYPAGTAYSSWTSCAS